MQIKEGVWEVGHEIKTDRKVQIKEGVWGKTWDKTDRKVQIKKGVWGRTWDKTERKVQTKEGVWGTNLYRYTRNMKKELYPGTIWSHLTPNMSSCTCIYSS